ncbi:MAG: isoprenylcysteine carboxylmethyltransferase family protein [Hyphomicrobiales bacterium]
MEKQAPAAHHHPWKIGDVVLFPLALLGLVAEWLMPIHAPFLPETLRIGFGIALAVAGVGMIVWAKRSLAAAAQPSLPGLPTTALVTNGAYDISRNPNYLGGIVAVFASGLVFNSVWLSASAIGSAIILQLWMIRPEEQYLSARFAADYTAYCKRVRRWL